MTAPTTNVTTVDPTVMDDYTAVTNGMKPGKRAEQRGVTPSTVSANVKRVRLALEAGHTVNVSGGGTIAPDASAPDAIVDIHAIANDMADGSALVTREWERVNDEHAAMVQRANDIIARATEQRDALIASADKLVADSEPVLARGFAVYGLDRDAWLARVDAERALASLTAEQRTAYDALTDDDARSAFITEHAGAAS